MCNVYVQKVPTVEGLQFDGENGDAIVEFVGGEDYGTAAGKTVILSPAGKDPRGTKIVVERGQFVSKSKTGTVVVNEGEFIAHYTNEDGSAIAGLPPLVPGGEEGEVVPEEELEYQPGFAPLTEEDKKRAEADRKKAEEKAKKRAEEKAAADKKQAATDKKAEHVVEHHR